MTPKITLVLFALSLCATAALVHSYDRLQMERVAPSGLFNAVQDQVAACRDQNFTVAYRQASTTTQQQWSRERFAAMLREDYLPRAMNGGRIEFGAWKQQDRRAAVAVYFIDREGTVTPCLFSLVREGSDWKIDATRWGKPWQPGQSLRGIRL